MVAVISIVAALRRVSLRKQDYKDNLALFPHNFPDNLLPNSKPFWQ